MSQAPPRRRDRDRGESPLQDRGRLRAGGRLFGRYRLVRPIGRGGSADVWRAHDERLDRTVAIKVLQPHLLPDAVSVGRFVAEARAAAGLSHPAVVPVFDVIEDPRTPAIVFRFVDGETLAARLERAGRMPAVEAAVIAADLAGALAHAHRSGLVHRDVKPGNVLLDSDGRAQLADFGIAHALEGATEKDATRGLVVGTLRYMAPERLAGQPVDARADLYSLGLVLHELLTGRPAFDSGSPAALVDSQRNGPPPPPAATPAGLTLLLRELLAVDPADRPPDADVVEGRLRAFIAEQPLPPVAGPPANGPDVPPRDPPAGPALDRESEADTVAFGSPPTIALAIPVRAAEPVPPLSRPSGRLQRRRRGPTALAVAGAIAIMGALVVALGIGGLRSAPAIVTGVGATASSQPDASPTVLASAPVAIKGPKPGHGHGHGGHGGN